MADHTRPSPLQPPYHSTIPPTHNSTRQSSGLPAPSYLGHPGGRGPTLPDINMGQPLPYGNKPLPRIQLPPLHLISSESAAGRGPSRSQHLALDELLSRDAPRVSTRTAQPAFETLGQRPNFSADQRSHSMQPPYAPPPYPPSVRDLRQLNDANVPPKRFEPEHARSFPSRDGFRPGPARNSQSSSPSTNYYNEEETSPRTPMPPPISTVPKLNYTLIIRQQPAAARACGFGERDRRVIDPPPILELKITDPETGAPKEDHPAMLALSCTLMTPDGKRDDTEVPGSEPNTQATRRLMGTLVASPYQAKDEHGVAGTFFVFPDLSCRSPGKFRLRWKLIRIDPTNMFPGQSSPAVANIMSDAFAVFTAKDFPGMRASSPLLKALRRQGLNVGVKKGSEARKGKGKTKKEESDSEDDDSEQSDVEGGASTTSRSTGGVSPKSKPRKQSVPKRKRRDS